MEVARIGFSTTNDSKHHERFTKIVNKIANLKDQSLSNKMSLCKESAWYALDEELLPHKKTRVIQHAIFPANTDRAVKSGACDRVSNPPNITISMV